MFLGYLFSDTFLGTTPCQACRHPDGTATTLAQTTRYCVSNKLNYRLRFVNVKLIKDYKGKQLKNQVKNIFKSTALFSFPLPPSNETNNACYDDCVSGSCSSCFIAKRQKLKTHVPIALHCIDTLACLMFPLPLFEERMQILMRFKRSCYFRILIRPRFLRIAWSSKNSTSRNV